MSQMSQTVAVIQARMGSTRFPGKVLAPITVNSVTAPMIEHVWRAVNWADGVDAVVLAIPARGQDALRAWAHDLPFIKLPVIEGEEDDVLGRFVIVAQIFPYARQFLRLTADCPMLQRPLIEMVVRMAPGPGDARWFIGTDETSLDGTDVELFSRAALVDAAQIAQDPTDREHVTAWMRRQPWATIISAPNRAGRTRSVNTAEDLAWVEWQGRGDG